METVKFTKELLEEVGLLGATRRGDLLIFHFRNRDEVWTLAPPDYPTDGSCEIVRCDGAIWVRPPEGSPS